MICTWEYLKLWKSTYCFSQLSIVLFKIYKKRVLKEGGGAREGEGGREQRERGDKERGAEGKGEKAEKGEKEREVPPVNE